MQTYKITITDNFFAPLSGLTGEFEAATEDHAAQQAKEYYAYELDTTEDEIQILSILKI